VDFPPSLHSFVSSHRLEEVECLYSFYKVEYPECYEQVLDYHLQFLEDLSVNLETEGKKINSIINGMAKCDYKYKTK
jgi:hypothetical protein